MTKRSRRGNLQVSDTLTNFIETCKSFNVMVSIGNPVMDVALQGGSNIVNDFLEKSSDLGIDIIEISSIARSIDDDDTCRLIETISKKGIKPLNEIGIAFAHSKVDDNSIFINKLVNQSKRFLEAGSWKILLESIKQDQR